MDIGGLAMPRVSFSGGPACSLALACRTAPHLADIFHIIPKVVEKCRQLLYLVLIRSLMHPVDKGQFLPVKMLSNGLVGRQHEVLDDPGSHIALIGTDLLGHSALIQQDLALREVKVYTAPFPPLFPQQARQGLHLLQHGQKLCILRESRIFFCQIILREQALHSGVGHTMTHPDHGFANLIIYDTALRVNGHQTTQGQPVHPRVQGTDAVAQCLRQHGYHPIHQIDAGAPP